MVRFVFNCANPLQNENKEIAQARGGFIYYGLRHRG